MILVGSFEELFKLVAKEIKMHRYEAEQYKEKVTDWRLIIEFNNEALKSSVIPEPEATIRLEVDRINEQGKQRTALPCSCWCVAKKEEAAMIDTEIK